MRTFAFESLVLVCNPLKPCNAEVKIKLFFLHVMHDCIVKLWRICQCSSKKDEINWLRSTYIKWTCACTLYVFIVQCNRKELVMENVKICVKILQQQFPPKLACILALDYTTTQTKGTVFYASKEHDCVFTISCKTTTQEYCEHC